VIPDASGFAIDELRGPSATGFSSDTLIFDLSYRQGGDSRKESLVVRIEPSGGFPVFPHYDVALQFDAMRAMKEKGVPVPSMRWLQRDESVLGSRFYVMDRIEGQVPTDTPPYHQAGWVSELVPADRAKLWWSGLDAMCQVHRIDPADPALTFLSAPPAGRTPIEVQLDDYERFLDWGCDRSRLPLIVRALDWLRENAPDDEPLGICWGDSRLANQIFQDLECVAVIDWEMVFLGNPVADLAWWVTVDRCFSEGIGIPRAEGFPSAVETVARWEQQVGRKAEHFAYYQIFAGFRFSIIMARIVGQMKHYEVLPADHDMDVTNLASFTLARLLEESGVRV
jgi:aminoglycoside phosphotransferase (APT) family kinase protein